jgi:hypothetical protein
MKNQSNTYDREIAVAMRFHRWLDIKACMKQNAYHQETKRGEPGYDPTQNIVLFGT